MKTGTDYCDLTGESLWAAEMASKYGDAAAKNGAILVTSAGYDSVPSDLCAFLAAQQLRERGTRVREMRGYASMSGAGFSGGTFASMLNMFQRPASELKRASDPYLLNPPDQRPARVLPQDRDQLLPHWDETIGRWTSPWIMASVNARVVRRSIALRKQLSEDGVGDGPDAAYNECQPHSSLVGAVAMCLMLVVTLLALMLRPIHPLLQRFTPKPGEGPSEEKRARTTFSHRVIARGEDGSLTEAVMRGGDPVRSQRPRAGHARANSRVQFPSLFHFSHASPFSFLFSSVVRVTRRQPSSCLRSVCCCLRIALACLCCDCPTPSLVRRVASAASSLLQWWAASGWWSGSREPVSKSPSRHSNRDKSMQDRRIMPATSVV